MKMKLATAILTTLLAAPFWGSIAAAQEGTIGQVDLGPLAEVFETTPKVNLNFGPAMMAGFAETVRAQNAELGGVLESIRGLRLMVFEDVDAGAVEPSVKQTATTLAEAGWTPALEVRDDDALVDLFLVESGEFVKGLVLMVREGGGTAIFANLHGDIEPAVVGRIIGSGQALDGLDFGELASQFQGSATAPEDADE